MSVSFDPKFIKFSVIAGEEPSSLLSNILVHYTLNEASGTVMDSTDSNIDLTAAGSPTYSASGKISAGINFAAATSVLYNSTPTGIQPTGDEFSFSCWINLNTLPSVSAEEAAIFRLGLAADPYYAIDCSIDTVNDINFVVRDTSNAIAVAWDGVTSTGVWYHVVGVSRGIGNAVELWINGANNAETYQTVAANINTGVSYFNIGNSYNGASNHLDGIIDEFAIWDRALTSGEIATLYNSGNGRTYPFS